MIVPDMMQLLRRYCVFLIVMFLLCPVVPPAQISPGNLTNAHAHLEGLANCTKCHTLGDKVPNDKCLDCHIKLRERIDAGRGFHVSAEVRGQDCIKCHSEHHGRNFEIIRFDIHRFDHDLTGYPLTGAHRDLDCTQCHNTENITDPQIRQMKNTYLGLSTDCISCHADYHRNTLPLNCAGCHTTESFAPATGFSHDMTEFPLRGQHRNVDCVACHAITQVDGEPFQTFAGVDFANCSSCHIDAHNGRFGTDCRACHVEESFHTFRDMGRFNHNRTSFPLIGKHLSVACSDCHNTNVSAADMFKDFAHLDVKDCASCHEDVHQQKFGNDCRACHSEESFQLIRDLSAFDHEWTGFALEGKHQEVDCRACHETKMTAPLPHNYCADCHWDFHEGQFVDVSRTPDCAECHTVDGFSGSIFTVEQHNASRFPLTGAHLATPCFACHLQEDKWLFKDIGERCIDCHEDVHNGSVAVRFMPDRACESCHMTESWSWVRFDHSLTDFALSGAHSALSCVACHVPDETTDTIRRVIFDGLSSACTSCHENVHMRQFEQDGVTDCRRCHSYDHWQPSDFDHNTARFVLEGAHITVACDQCHREVEEEDAIFVLYRIENFACADCHR